MINQAFVYSKSNKLFVHTNMVEIESQLSFGDWLRNKIKENDISNAELARRIDVSPTYIGNLVRDFSPNSKTGKIRASELIVEAIAKALNADINEARKMAGYASDDELVADGLFSGYYELPEERRTLARKQIAAIIRSLKDEDFE